jgi:hypothetical protein
LYSLYKMSSFIAASNQEMLWRTIQKNSLFGQTLTQEQQPIWFREIIGNFYSETTNKNLTNNLLLELNKNTLRYMVHNLKQYASQSSQTSQTSQTSHASMEEPINDRLQPQSSSYQGDYDKLQSNYNNMHQRIVPKEPDFKEKFDNEKITNMDELLQQQLKDRELETQIPPIQTPPIQTNSNSLKTVQNKSESTNVKFAINESSTQTTNNDIGELKNLFQTLLRKMDDLEREMNVMRSQLIHKPNNEENKTNDEEKQPNNQENKTNDEEKQPNNQENKTNDEEKQPNNQERLTLQM